MTEEAARPLEGRGLDNLVAFSRLLGYVRHFHPSDEAATADWNSFHPSDEAATADWNSFAIAGIRSIEGARTPEELAQRLEELVRPLAPTVRVFPAGEHPAVPRALTAPEGDRELTVVAWEHRGFGPVRGLMALRSTYTSKRNREKIRDGKLPSGLPDPARPPTFDLGGGVSCPMPVAVFADEHGTIPEVEKPEKGKEVGLAAAAAAVPPKSSGNDRATRLAAVALGWNILQHFYPYFDVVDADWPAELPRALRSAANDPHENAFLDTLRRMIAALDDGHGTSRESRSHQASHRSETPGGLDALITDQRP